MESKLNHLEAKINEALAAKGYKSMEAKAQYWSKITEKNQLIERIYMRGGKASGYIAIENGKPAILGVRHLPLLYILEDVLKGAAL